MHNNLDFNPYLDTRFQPYILNTTSNPKLLDLRNRLDEIFGKQSDPNHLMGFKPLSRIKSHILTHSALPGWIIKQQRNDQYSSGEEQNLYRVLTIARIQKVIEENHFTTVATPQKFLYEFKGKWFVIAEKMDILPDIKINSVPWEYPVPTDLLRDLTPQQAEELAVICYEAGLPDVGAHNLSYLRTGEVCTFDSEPLTLSVQKRWSRFPLPGIERAVNFFFAKANAQRLHDMCRNQESRQAVEKVQKAKLVKQVATFTAQAALPLLAASGACYLAMNNPTSTLVKIASSTGVAVTALNAISSATLLGLSVFGNYLTGPFEYEGDLMDKYAN